MKFEDRDILPLIAQRYAERGYFTESVLWQAFYYFVKDQIPNPHWSNRSLSHYGWHRSFVLDSIFNSWKQACS